MKESMMYFVLFDDLFISAVNFTVSLYSEKTQTQIATFIVRRKRIEIMLRTQID